MTIETYKENLVKIIDDAKRSLDVDREEFAKSLASDMSVFKKKALERIS